MGDVVKFPGLARAAKEPWPSKLTPRGPAAMEEYGASLSLLSCDGSMMTRIRIVAPSGDWIVCLPGLEGLRGHVITALRGFISEKLAHGLIISVADVDSFDTWVLAQGALIGDRQLVSWDPLFASVGETIPLTEADLPPVTWSFAAWFCQPGRVDSFDPVIDAMSKRILGPGGSWTVIQIARHNTEEVHV